MATTTTSDATRMSGQKIGLRCLAAALAMFVTATMHAVPVFAQNALTDAQKAAVETLIQKYIAENPDKILNSVRAHNRRQEAEAAAAAETNLVRLGDRIKNDPRAPVAGNPDGDVTLVEFFDYRCGYCKRSLDTVLTVIREDPNLRVVFHEFPILSPESRRAAQAAMASIKQGKYLEFHAALMRARGRLDDQQIMDVAAEVGLDVRRLARDMQSPDIEAYLESVSDLARSLDIGGTPTFIVEDQIFRGAIDADTMRRAIAEKRAG